MGKTQPLYPKLIIFFFLNQGDELESLDVEGDPTYVYCLRFCPEELSRHLLALANEDGRVSIVDTSEKSCVKTEFGAHQNAIFDLAWMPGSEQKVSRTGLKLTIVISRKLNFVRNCKRT